MTNISPHFDDREFFSPDVYEMLVNDGVRPQWLIDRTLVQILEELRAWLNNLYDEKVIIEITHTESGVNGFVTSSQNATRNSSNPKKGKWSQHQYGRAVDIVANRIAEGRKIPVDPKEIQKYFENTLSFGGLGKGKTFTHVDTRFSNHLIIWEYND